MTRPFSESRGRRFAPALMPAAALLLLSACAVTPEPISDGLHLARALTEKEALYAGQEPLSGPLTLSEAIARSLKYNLDHRLALMEEAVQGRQLTLANFNMLPRLAANAGYTTRSNENLTVSRSERTGLTSPDPSLSTDPDRWTGDISFTWNLLDFGVSYYQAQQQADRTLIAVERRRRVINNMVKEVRSAYWRAATAQRLLPLLDPILADARRALEATDEIERDLLQPPLATLEYRKTLLQVIAQLRRLRSELSVARAQLAALVNVPPGEPLSVVVPEGRDLEDVGVNLPEDVSELELYGLTYRPELREEVYQERIDGNGVRKEMLSMLPGVSLLSSLNVDSNSFLVNQIWAEAGFRATWNLLGLIQGPRAVEAAETQAELTRTRRLAVSVAVITQVNVSYQQYKQALENYETAYEISKVEERILQMAEEASALEAEAELERIRRAASSVAAQLDRDRSLAEVEAALANIYLSIGVDTLPAALEADDLDTLETEVEAALARFERGELPPLPEPAVAQTAEPMS